MVCCMLGVSDWCKATISRYNQLQYFCKSLLLSLFDLGCYRGKPIQRYYYMYYYMYIYAIIYIYIKYILIYDCICDAYDTIIYFKFYCLRMISHKRPYPFHQQNTIIIDSDDEPVIEPGPRKAKYPVANFNSLQNPYEAIPEVPNITLTVEQMQGDPIALIKELQKMYCQFGAVKITACQQWNFPFNLACVDKPVTVRKQVLQDLTKARPFEQVPLCMHIPTYRDKANAFAKTYHFKTNPKGNSAQARLQQQYWNLVSNPQYKQSTVCVQYAADLPTSQYGSGFPTRQKFNLVDHNFSYHTNLWNLNNLYKSPSSMLRVVQAKKQNISGITQPWLYIGMQFATFCWHVQDLYINSVNYNHMGATKTWYVIPASQKQLFDQHVATNYQNKKKKHLLERITLMVDPLQIMRAGIKVYKLQQRPKDYAVTFVKAYHGGFSHGFNVGQAVNFLGYDSIGVIKEACKNYENQHSGDSKMKSSVIPFEWIIYENVNQGLSIPGQYKDTVLKQYKRVINRQYVFVKSFMDQNGPFKQIKVLDSKKKYTSMRCSHCKNYVYLASLKCVSCERVFCQRHYEKCECSAKQWVLHIRETNNDRSMIRNLLPQVSMSALSD